MDVIEQVILFRGIERLIIILFSGLSLVLGWHLFKIGILSDQKAEIKAGNIWIKFQKVGPGVFFALFGVAVFIHSLSSPFNFEFSGVDTKGKPKLMDTSGFYAKGSYSLQNQEKYLKLSKSINTIREIFITATPNVSRTDKHLLSESIKHLENERDYWVENLYGNKSVLLWNTKGNDYLINPESVDQESREKLKVIKQWMSETLESM